MPNSCCREIQNHTPILLMRLLIKKNSLCRTVLYKAEVSALSPSLTTSHPVIRWGCVAHRDIRGWGTPASEAAPQADRPLWGPAGRHGAPQVCHHCREVRNATNPRNHSAPPGWSPPAATVGRLTSVCLCLWNELSPADMFLITLPPCGPFRKSWKCLLENCRQLMLDKRKGLLNRAHGNFIRE